MTRLHLMRVNGEGETSDVVAKEWTATDQIVYTLNPSTRIYTSVETHTGPNGVDISEHIITNADQGALYSWQSTEQCYASGTQGTRTYIQVEPCVTTPENHLTTFSADANVSDRAWTPGAAAGEAVHPVIQLSDGAFAGDVQTPSSGSTALIVFEANGQLRWLASDVRAAKATGDGGLIAEDGDDVFGYDRSGAIIRRSKRSPFESWAGNSYRIGSLESVREDVQMPVSLWSDRTATGATPQHTSFFDIFVPIESGVLAEPPNLRTVYEYQQQLKNLEGTSIIALQRIHLWNDSKGATFKGALANRQNDAVAFIGHSVTISPFGSVGLKLSDTALLKRHDPQWFDDRDCLAWDAQGRCTGSRSPFQFTTPIDHFDWNARVVFIALCDAAETFLELWQIEQTTPGRSLIVPVWTPTSKIDRNVSALAWVWISIKLSNGSSVYDAAA